MLTFNAIKVPLFGKKTKETPQNVQHVGPLLREDDCFVSARSNEKLNKYAVKAPYTSPTTWFLVKKRLSATNPEHAEMMPRMHIGLCWGGSALREGASKYISAAEPKDKLAIAADAYLLARRQRTENILWTLSKGIAFPVHLMPLEGGINAHQVKNLMETILRDNGVDINQLKKINYLKMSTAHQEESTPIRHLFTLRASILPKNTEKTRKHLYTVMPEATHEKLSSVLGDAGNYISSTLDTSQPHCVCAGAVLSEKGWQKILRLAISRF